MPRGEIDNRAVMRAWAADRRALVRKDRALQQSIRFHDKVRAGYGPARKSKRKGTPVG